MLVSPTLISAADHGLILGEEVEVHGKGMREALKCRELLGHEDHPELSLKEETSLTTLAHPLPFCYQVLTGKQLDGQMQPATLLSVSPRQAMVEVAGQLARRANIMLRLEVAAGGKETPELYAKVMRPTGESEHRYLIHFTSVPPAVREWLQRMAPGTKGI